MNKKIILTSLLLLSGCSLFQEKKPVDKLVYVTTPLYAPARPTLPTWKGDDMECLSDEMKDKIRDRDLLRKQYAEQLETIINSTHTK
jgi:hypothetical protein